ncbi:uncharacterized protein [Palaemon carinicauda]|uniref:uncharacterized protein isoform X1 n=2 Tax=Palaemon carinicauda TaxID=392227 RepID=UPI0035B5C0E5
MGTLLADSSYCRLCATESDVGFTIFDDSEEKASLAILINKYLPIKVVDNGQLPVRICERCHMGVAATVDLIDRMVEGQQKLRALLQAEEQLPSVQSTLIDIQGDTDDIPMDDLAKGAEVSKVFAENHPMSIAVDGPPPKRKRGRPRKGEGTPKLKTSEEEIIDDRLSGMPRRSNRKASLPTRYRDTIAGQDFEKLLDVNVKEEDPDDGDMDDTDVDYRYNGTYIKPSLLGVTPEDYREKEDLEKMSDDGTSIIIAAEPAEQPSDLPVSVNIEVDFQDDGNITLRGMEDFPRDRKRLVPSVQITSVGESVSIPPKTSFSEPTLFRKKRGAKKKVKWSCDICGKGFLHKGRYVLHTRLHKQVILQCAFCKDKFSTLEDLNIHQSSSDHKGLGIIEIENEGEKVDFKCPHCPNRTFVTQEGYNTHVSSMHEGAKPFACATCGKRFAYQHSLRNHYALHEPPKEEREYPCTTCGKVFTHPSSLIYHRESTHNNGRLFVCHICNASFKHKQLLQRHYSVHSEERPYPCEICHQAFKTRGNLYNHMNTHTGLKKFTCEICGKQFNHLTSLTLHVRSHTGEKPFKCEFCAKRFTQNGNLQEHIRIHTGEKPFCCENCGKKFTTSSQFKLHMRRHSGDRPFTCSYCSKGFLNRETCRAHERKHRGEKPYICAVCNKGFSEQYTLRKHLRMHTGEKPYTCSICSKTFRDASNLHKHRRSHREDETWYLPGGASVEESDGDHPIIYIIKDDPDATTFTALQAVDSEMGENSHLENMTEREAAHMIQGFSLTAYEQPSTAAAVMIQERGSQDSDRQIQIFTDENGRSVIPFINENGRSVIPVINSSGETIGEVQGQILAGSESNPEVGALGNSALEMAFKDGQPFSLVIPEGEDPSLYVHRALESAVMSHQKVATHSD